jgi:hypothetical protein
LWDYILALIGELFIICVVVVAVIVLRLFVLTFSPPDT